ncbi:MAG: hypothetical protein U0900_12380 [Myxococcota bacterium]
MARIRLALPHHLRNLAGVGGELALEVERGPEGEVTLVAVLSALEARFPMLRGTIRDQASGRRRPFVRFFACRQDLSHEPMTAPLPREVADGGEVLIVLGAVAGG